MSPATPLVAVTDLTLAAGSRSIVDGISFQLAAGISVGLVGASGAGKTTTAQALLGYLRPGVSHVAGTIRVRGERVLPHPPAWLRGRTIAYLSQDPGQALNPYRRIGPALLDLAGATGRDQPPGQFVADLLRRVHLPADPDFARRYPHQLSGGQQQRVALAMALCRNPQLLVLDEPTTGLDAHTRAEVLRELARVHAAGIGLLWISHDLGLLRSVADRVLVLDSERIVEDGPVDAVLGQPSSPAARRLVAAIPQPVGAKPRPPGTPLVRVRDLTAGYGGMTVLCGVDLTVGTGECLAILGVSGAGKTTLGRCLAGLHRPRSGEIRLADRPLAADARRRSRDQRARLQLIAQDPAEALHPRQPVRAALVRPLTVLRGIRGAALAAHVERLLDAVGLPGYEGRLPAELSGGERQRVAIARALAADPAVLICDEITSALDLVTQAAILDLLARARREYGLAMVLITHDPAIAATADRRVSLVDGRGYPDGPPGLTPPATGTPASPAAALRSPPLPG